MTVEQLITRLQELPPQTLVLALAAIDGLGPRYYSPDTIRVDSFAQKDGSFGAPYWRNPRRHDETCVDGVVI